MGAIAIFVCIHYLKTPQSDTCRYVGMAATAQACKQDVMRENLIVGVHGTLPGEALRYVCMRHTPDWRPVGRQAQ